MRRSPNYYQITCPGIGSHWLAHEADDETKGYQSLRNEFSSAQWTEKVVSSATTKGSMLFYITARRPCRNVLQSDNLFTRDKRGRFSTGGTGGRRDGRNPLDSGNEGENKQQTAGKLDSFTGLPHTAHVRTRGV
ncbi:hypothetical protein E5D57_002756 [Metarhizium anisopliae]|nr:hypothetical protein E5D57_002756 [Metarhizium anisopliae]